jgi:hypothetical protein
MRESSLGAKRDAWMLALQHLGVGVEDVVLLNLSTNCWNSAFNAQGSRVIILVVQVGGALKMYVATMEVLGKKERQDETQVHHQNWWKN